MTRPSPAIVIGSCRVSRVIDGDTIELDVTRKVRVRLRDCWAPETRTTKYRSEKAQGQAAKEALEMIASEDATCTLQVLPDGDEDIGDGVSFGRVVGDVWLPPSQYSLAERMVHAGLAFRTKDELREHLRKRDVELYDDM